MQSHLRASAFQSLTSTQKKVLSVSKKIRKVAWNVGAEHFIPLDQPLWLLAFIFSIMFQNSSVRNSFAEWFCPLHNYWHDHINGGVGDNTRHLFKQLLPQTSSLLGSYGCMRKWQLFPCLSLGSSRATHPWGSPSARWAARSAPGATWCPPSWHWHRWSQQRTQPGCCFLQSLSPRKMPGHCWRSFLI